MHVALRQIRVRGWRRRLRTSFALDAAVFVVLVGGFIVSRTANLLALPMFFDETYYAREARYRHASVLSTWDFPIADYGVPPLFVWLAAPIARVVTNPLLAVRLASVAAGVLGLIPVWWSGRPDRSAGRRRHRRGALSVLPVPALLSAPGHAGWAACYLFRVGASALAPASAPSSPVIRDTTRPLHCRSYLEQDLWHFRRRAAGTCLASGPSR